MPPFLGRYILVLVAWMALLATGFGGLMKYDSTPAPLAPAAILDNPQFRDGKAYSLVMAIHPYCPCSRATVGELIKIYSHGHDNLKITIFAFKPADEPDSWIESSTIKTLEQMKPRIVIDSDGSMAKRLALGTSGQALLYSPAGKLLFNGGITSGRAHAGDNLGEDTILSLLRGEAPEVHSTAVFGCSISEEKEAR